MDVEKVIEALEQLKFFNQRAGRELWNDKSTDIQNKDIDNAEKKIDDAIQTIRELQSNQCYLYSPCEYQNKDKELQEQNKWHYCSDEFPKESGHYLVAYHEWSDGNFLPKYDYTRVRTMHFQNSELYVGWNYPVCCDERAENDTYREVIAWRELPKFEEVE